MMDSLESTLEEDFDWSSAPELLRENYKRTNFDSIFIKLIARDVIKILSPQLSAETSNPDHHEHLIGPLEKFICDLDSEATADDVAKAFENIRTLNQPTKLCRRVLKTGDVTFSCNECRLDETCVLCIDCFHKSAHKDHSYRMSHSDGGGCCDCGDVEAWKQYHACADHLDENQTNKGLKDFEDRNSRFLADSKACCEKIKMLPKGVASKYFLVCQASLHYARMIFSWDHYRSLPPLLEVESNNELQMERLLSKESSSKNYFTVLFNDEVHTYDHVINTLVKIIKCTKMTASIMASTISREGRSLIANDNYGACKQIKDMIATARDAGQDPLKVEVIHGSVLAHQAFALELVEWIRKMSSLCDGFRILTAYTLLGTVDALKSTGQTLVEEIMLSNTSYWKTVRVEWNNLFVATLLTEYSIKEKFARLLTRNYYKLMRDFIDDDHDHSISALSMTTQLYTVPSLVCMLIEEENALSILSRILFDICMMSRRENQIQFESRNHTFDMHGLKRGFYIIADLKHLINLNPTKWTDGMRGKVIDAVEIFLDLLSSMQGMDSVRRQVGQHIEYEQDWESGMSLQSRLITFITRLVEYCSLDEEVLRATLKATQIRLLGGSYKMSNRELFGFHVSCIQYDVSTSPVSVHLPLTRFAAALIIELMRVRPSEKVPYDESLVILNDPPEDGRPKYSMIDIMEPSLRTEVMIAQFRSGMWRRNGYSLVNQILYFHGPLMRKEMFDRDILVLQECAAMCEANQFMIHLLNKFQLMSWASLESIKNPFTGSNKASYHNDEEVLTQTMSLGEEFLQLLLTIIGERYRVGVGVIEPDDVIKNEVIQLLCIGPAKRSDLIQKLYVDDDELNCIEAVANFRRSTEASAGKYELKDEYYQQFNPFFYHYSRRQQSNALDAQLKRKKNLKEALLCCPPPPPVELEKQFSNLNALLICDVTIMIVQKVLMRALISPEDTQECSSKSRLRFTASDLQLDQCLHLIGLGLYEQLRNPSSFKYIQAAQEANIFTHLKACYEQAKRSKDLILWLMKKTYTLIEAISRDPSTMDEYTTGIIASIEKCLAPALYVIDTTKLESKKMNSELAAQRRERIMAMMKSNQDKFLSNPITKQLVVETEKNESPQVSSHVTPNTPNLPAQSSSTSQVYTTRSGRKSKPPSMLGSIRFDQEVTESSQANPPASMMDEFICYESNDQMDTDEIETSDCGLIEPPETTRLCILCRDEQRIGFDQPTMVLLAYIQRSAVLSKNRKRRIPNYALTPSNQRKPSRSGQPNSPDMYSFTSDNSSTFDATFMPNDLFYGPHISTCGHVMHYDCWKGFFDAIIKRENSRPNRNTRHVSFELEKHEILCPLCECISNATIPLLPNYTKFAEKRPSLARKFTIFSASQETIDKSSENLAACLNALRSTVESYNLIRHDKHNRLLQPKSINDVLQELDENEAQCLRDFLDSNKRYRIPSYGCTKNLLSSISTLSERIHTFGLDLDRKYTDHDHSRIFMMTSWSISYTIQVFERLSRFKGTPLFKDLESSRSLCLSSLLRFACSSMMTHQPDRLQSLLVKKLRYLLISDEHLSSSPCCLDIDAFEMFVSLQIMLQKLYVHMDEPINKSSGSEASTSPFSSSWSIKALIGQSYTWATRVHDHEYYRNLLHLMLILNMLQITITMQNDLKESLGGQVIDDDESGPKNPSQQIDSKELKALYGFYRDVVIASGHPNNKMPFVNEEFSIKIKNHLLPFLRSCAIFFCHLSHIPPPEILKTSSAFFEGKRFSNTQTEPTEENDSDINLDTTDQEFKAICQYLDLPDDFATLLQSREANDLARSWLRHSRVLILIKSSLDERGPDLLKASTDVPARKNSSLAKQSSSTQQPSPSPAGKANEASTSRTELMPVKFIRQPHLVNRLIDLPYDYRKLFDSVSDFTCLSIKNEDLRTPTMCLICGVMLCSQSYCCQRDLNDLASNYQQMLQRLRGGPSSTSISGQAAEQPSNIPVRTFNSITNVVTLTGANLVQGPNFEFVHPLLVPDGSIPFVSNLDASSIAHQQLVGSCTYHAYECSGGVGVFLRIRNCQILLLSGRSKGCYMPAPYLDDRGETDFGLMRGKPLVLNRQHYEKLQHMWLAHAIPEQISRTLEYSPYTSSINWHLH